MILAAEKIRCLKEKILLIKLMSGLKCKDHFSLSSMQCFIGFKNAR